MTFGEEFRKARIAADKGLKEVTEMLGRSMTTLQRIENDNPNLTERTKERARVVLEQLTKEALLKPIVVNE